MHYSLQAHILKALFIYSFLNHDSYLIGAETNTK